MSILGWEYLNEMRTKQIADALGGEVWVAERQLHWRPAGSSKHVVIPWRELSEPFNPDEYATAAWAAWEASGAVL